MGVFRCLPGSGGTQTERCRAVPGRVTSASAVPGTARRRRRAVARGKGVGRDRQPLPGPPRPGRPGSGQAAEVVLHRFQAEMPNECWQSDFTHYPLAGGNRYRDPDLARRPLPLRPIGHRPQPGHRSRRPAGLPRRLRTARRQGLHPHRQRHGLHHPPRGRQRRPQRPRARAARPQSHRLGSQPATRAQPAGQPERPITGQDAFDALRPRSGRLCRGCPPRTARMPAG